eukprot:1625068-Amphidinium_carterae.1
MLSILVERFVARGPAKTLDDGIGLYLAAKIPQLQIHKQWQTDKSHDTSPVTGGAHGEVWIVRRRLDMGSWSNAHHVDALPCCISAWFKSIVQYVHALCHRAWMAADVTCPEQLSSNITCFAKDLALARLHMHAN